MKLKHFLIFLIIAAAATSCTSTKKINFKKIKSIPDSDFVRVLLFTSGESIALSSESRLRITEKKTKKIIFDKTATRTRLHADKVSDILIVESWSSPVIVNENPYRGFIEIHNVLGKLYIINHVKIEEYLLSVVGSEIPSSWKMEALKAQAVAARSYSRYNIMNRNKKDIYDLSSSTSSQVYRGIAGEKEPTTQAVIATAGEIISKNGEPLPAYFHSTCGGQTIDSKYVWGGENNHLNGVKCEYCRESPHFDWQAELTISELKNSLKKKYRTIGNIKSVDFKKKEGRVVEVLIVHTGGKINLTGNAFRLMFPDKKIKSMYFTSTRAKESLVLKGHGWGHGVGLCQWGAKGLAQKGANHRSILKFYYRGIDITNTGAKNVAFK